MELPVKIFPNLHKIRQIRHFFLWQPHNFGFKQEKLDFKDVKLMCVGLQRLCSLPCNGKLRCLSTNKRESAAFWDFLSGKIGMRISQKVVLHALTIILSFRSQFLVQNWPISILKKSKEIRQFFPQKLLELKSTFLNFNFVNSAPKNEIEVLKLSEEHGEQLSGIHACLSSQTKNLKMHQTPPPSITNQHASLQCNTCNFQT